MNEVRQEVQERQAHQERPTLEAGGRRARWVPLLLPAALLLLLVGALSFGDLGARLANGAPPPEEVAFDRVVLREGTIEAHVRNAVSAPVTLAQVMVDDAFWDFAAEPSAQLPAFGSATIRVAYPWVEGEPHVLAVLTHTGLVWEHEIAVAAVTPALTGASLGAFALVGVVVGFLPVAAGMAFYPAMREAPAGWTNALLALTLGLLAFLAVDTLGEGIDLAHELPGSFQGLGLFWGAALLALVGVLALERALRGGRWALALLIAIGIGLHNLGEGLVIGSALALGSLALGTSLLVGFAVHNVTEGPAIVSPLGRATRGLGAKSFALLASIAGLPTVLGAWLGAFASFSVLPVVFFGLGAGAIVVVLVQVGAALRREGPLVTPLHLGAFALGYAIMLATSLLTA